MKPSLPTMPTSTLLASPVTMSSETNPLFGKNPWSIVRPAIGISCSPIVANSRCGLRTSNSRSGALNKSRFSMDRPFSRFDCESLLYGH